jgi:beta-lactamase regulating signal transducer with metallopeptidase domain
MLTHMSAVALLVVKATIILLAALGITRLMQRASAGARHLVWLVTLATLVLVPSLTAWAPITLPILAPATTSVTRADSPATPSSLSPLSSFSSPSSPSSPASTSSTSAVRPLRPAVVAVAAWALVVAIIVASFAWSALVVRRIVRRARPLDTADWRTPLFEIADRLGLDEPPRLLVSGDAKMPFACGVLVPTIVLPEECDQWSRDRRLAVLLHELAHVRRKDLLGHMLGRVVCAAYWFHPLVWMAAKELRAESERACDDLALACGTRATDYAEHLLDIVTSVRRDATPVVALAMARRKEFEGRMLAILDPDLRHSTPTRRQSVALIVALAFLGATVAAVAPVPRQAIAAPITASAPVAASVSAPAAPALPATPRRAARPAQVVLKIGGDTPKIERGDTPKIGKGDKSSILDTAGQSPNDRAELLAKILRTDTDAKLRRVAAWGLQNFGDNTVAADALVYALGHDTDASVREMAAWSMSEYANSTGVTDALATALHADADEPVRETAAWSLGDIGRRESVDALSAALSDKSPEVQRHAAWALGQIGEKSATPALLPLLKSPDAETRRMASWALFQIEDPAAVPALQAALKSEKNSEAEIAELRAITVLGDQALDAIRGLLESPDPEVKSMAVRALAGGHAAGPWPMPMPRPRPFP